MAEFEGNCVVVVIRECCNSTAMAVGGSLHLG